MQHNNNNNNNNNGHIAVVIGLGFVRREECATCLVPGVLIEWAGRREQTSSNIAMATNCCFRSRKRPAASIPVYGVKFMFDTVHSQHSVAQVKDFWIQVI
jgi:hypothetical protein